MSSTAIIANVKKEINLQLADAETLKSLIDTTFTNKGRPMDAMLVKRALLEGMLRGFTFEDFLKRNVYAIPFGDTYSLVTSIDNSRKIGAKSGIVGVEEPVFTYNEDGGINRCSVTVHKRFADGYVGKFTAAVKFSEYATGQNLWKTKPETMIAKVAEMHALRKACPEELAQSYVEEEMHRETASIRDVDAKEIDDAQVKQYEAWLRDCKTKEDLERVWADIPGDYRAKLKPAMEEVKAMIMSEDNSEIV